MNHYNHTYYNTPSQPGGDKWRKWITWICAGLIVSALLIGCATPYPTTKHRILSEKQYRKQGIATYKDYENGCTPYRPRRYKR